jgi:hypothetical protein
VNGTLSINPATLTPGLTGSVVKTYDTTVAATLEPGNYTLSGVLSGDSVALTNPAGTYDTKNVGINKQVNVSGLALTGAAAGNYVLASSSVSAAIGVINAAPLTVELTGTVSKTFDGTNAATLAPGNYSLTGVLAGDSVVLNNPADGTYDDSTVGSDKLVSVSGLELTGADSANYALPSDEVSGRIGEITASVADNGIIAVLTQTPFVNSIVTLIVTPPVPPEGAALIPPMMMENPIESEGGQDEPAPADAVAGSVGQSLSGALGSVPSRTIVLINGLLSQVVPGPGASTPQGVPPADQNYPSWGNAAFWEIPQ